jgi:hypothetical protein
MKASTFKYHQRVLVDYLRAKVSLGDWHGVSDAANDIRVLEAEYNANPEKDEE